jgi:hypothetical protein
LQHWFTSRAARNGHVGSGAAYGTWDAAHEKFRPHSSESALDQVAAQGGQSWTMSIYNAVL